MSVGATMLPELETAAQRMPFDQFGRYHMLREALDAARKVLDQAQFSVLDVGGYFKDRTGQDTLPIVEFLPHDQVTVLDVVECDLPGYIKGDGAALDFKTDGFDFVVTADTLEHIPRPRREAFWQELLRVAKHGVVLLAPFGTPEVEAAEAIVFAYIKEELHVEQAQLQEHKEYGLPRLEEWQAYFDKQGIYAKTYPTGYLHAWLGMMLIKHMFSYLGAELELQQQLDYMYNQGFFPTERRHPAYRYLVVAEHTPGLVDAIDEVLAPTIMPPVEDVSQGWSQGLGPLLQLLSQRQMHLQHHTFQQIALTQQHHLSLNQEQVAQQQQQIAQQQQQIAQQQQQISVLERVLADQQILINHLHQELGARQAAIEAQVGQQHLFQRELQGYMLEKQQALAATEDLARRAAWLEEQNTALRAELEAVQNGIVLRVLKRLT